MTSAETHLALFPMLAAGLTNSQAAQRLGLTKSQVGHLLEDMFRETRTSSRAEAVAWAYAKGIMAAGVWPPALAPRFQRRVVSL